MKLLLFVGAGASVELGVPAMRKMTEQLADHLNQQGIDEGLIKRLKARLDSPEYDMEELVEDLDKLVEASKAAERWRFEDESTQEKRKMTILRQETEWFVQHVCERVQLHHAQRLWTGLLTELSNHDSTIATTNYDRAVELASSSSAVQLEDGFMKFEKSEVTEWEGFSGNSISYLKLHGSTNWYRSENEDVYKLRHPMALFGNLRLVVPHVDEDQPFRLKSAVVLPSREKVVREPPYDDIRYEFQSAYRETEIAFFVGTSLRDPDLRSAASNCSERVPTYLVGPSAEEQVSNLNSDVEALNATASQFLCSSLPAALSADRIGAIEDYVEQLRGIESILPPLVTAFNSEATIERRCEAIEKLADYRVSLLQREVEVLLECEDEDVSRFALGLIPDSPDADELTELVEQMAGSRATDQFAEEVELLEKF